MNVGAAGTFVSRRRVTAKDVAAELPFETAILVVPAAAIVALVDEGPPRTATAATAFVSILTAAPTKHPTLPLELPIGRDPAVRVVERRGRFVVTVRRIEARRGLDLNGIVERAFGVPSTTRTWGTIARIRAALA